MTTGSLTDALVNAAQPQLVPTGTVHVPVVEPIRTVAGTTVSPPPEPSAKAVLFIPCLIFAAVSCGVFIVLAWTGIWIGAVFEAGNKPARISMLCAIILFAILAVIGLVFVCATCSSRKPGDKRKFLRISAAFLAFSLSQAVVMGVATYSTLKSKGDDDEEEHKSDADFVNWYYLAAAIAVLYAVSLAVVCGATWGILACCACALPPDDALTVVVSTPGHTDPHTMQQQHGYPQSFAEQMQVLETRKAKVMPPVVN